MNTEEADPLAGSLTHTDSLVVAVSPLAALPTGLQLADANRSAAMLLALLISLDEPPPLLDESPELLAHLQRLDQKLDLLMELVGQWLHGELALPPAQLLRLSARGVVWRPAQALPAGPASVRLYLQPGLPKPLDLPAMLRPLEDGSMLAAFAGLDGPVTDALERYIFRCHRRAVAQARRPA